MGSPCSIKGDYDLIVVGGGPGGSTIAAFVAKQGYRVLLLERETFPRHKIGESLIPATVHGVFHLLGFQSELDNAGFVRKIGAGFRWGRNPDPWHIRFTHSAALAEAGANYAYQVPRAQFDAMLLAFARRQGVEVCESHRCEDVLIEDGRVCGVSLYDSAGQHKSVRASYVADASGHSSSLFRHVGERIHSTFLRNVAVHGYLMGGSLQPPPFDGTILCEAFDEGWMWHIPLSHATPPLISIGAVIDRDRSHLLLPDARVALQNFITACPYISKLLTSAQWVTNGMYGEIRIRRDWTYTTTRFWRPGLVLVGDAACFIDPILSTGVHFATYSALLAARSINTHLARELPEQIVFDEFDRRYRFEYEVFYNFILAFYDMHRDQNSYFWEARKILGASEPEDEAFVRLLGGGATDPDLYFSKRTGLGDIVQRFSDRVLDPTSRQNPEMLTRRLAEEVFLLGRIPSNTQSPPEPLSNQDDPLGAALSADSLLPIPHPVESGRLVPSADGLRWRLIGRV